MTRPPAEGPEPTTPDRTPLTPREREVLRLVAARFDNAEIADRLTISKRTVEAHVAALMRKLGVRNRRGLIAAAGPTAFRFELSDMLRTTPDPVRMQTRAAELVGRYLQVNRAYHQEFDWAAGTFTVRTDYTDGRAPVAGTYPLSAYADDPVMDTLRTGRTLVVRNAAHLSPTTAAAWDSIGVRAAMAVPTMRDGVTVAALGVTSATPRDWSAEDVAVLEETAERTWAAVELTRLEQQLWGSEQRFRVVADSLSSLVWQADGTGAPSFVNRRFREFTGVDDAVDWRLQDYVHHDPVDFMPPDDPPDDPPGDDPPGDDPATDDPPGGGTLTWRGAVRRADGRWCPCTGSVTSLTTPDGTVAGTLGIVSEVDT